MPRSSFLSYGTNRPCLASYFKWRILQNVLSTTPKRSIIDVTKVLWFVLAASFIYSRQGNVPSEWLSYLAGSIYQFPICLFKQISMLLL